MKNIFVMTTVATGGLQSSTLWTGFLQMLNDATTIAMIACPIIAGLLWIIFSIARAAADDEPTQKKWSKKMKDCIIFGIAGLVGSGIIAVVSSYFVAG